MLIGKETIGQLAKQRPYPLCVVNCHIILFIKQTLCIQTHRLNTKHGLVRDAVTLIYQGIKLMCQYWQSHNWECLIFEVIFFFVFSQFIWSVCLIFVLLLLRYTYFFFSFVLIVQSCLFGYAKQHWTNDRPHCDISPARDNCCMLLCLIGFILTLFSCFCRSLSHSLSVLSKYFLIFRLWEWYASIRHDCFRILKWRLSSIFFSLLFRPVASRIAVFNMCHQWKHRTREFGIWFCEWMNILSIDRVCVYYVSP